jgi:AI-2 transport protein TqsA
MTYAAAPAVGLADVVALKSGAASINPRGENMCPQTTDSEKTGWSAKGHSHSLLRFLQGAACTVIVLWGMKNFSELLGPLLLGVMLSYGAVALPEWLMLRFKLSKGRALSLTALVLAAAGLSVIVTMEVGLAQLATRLPIYAQRLGSLGEQVTAFMNAQGLHPTNFSIHDALTAERLGQIAALVIPTAGVTAAKVFLVFLLAFLFVLEMLKDAGGKPSPIGGFLSRHGLHAKGYLAVTVKSTAINSVLNLVFLVTMGVELAFLWALLYFFLNFIPTVGFTIALIPPTLVTLLMYGWTKALVVAGGLILANMFVDNVVTPFFARRALNISFLELTLSLVGWSFLLGLPGAMIAIPLTVALKDFVAKQQARA